MSRKLRRYNKRLLNQHRAKKRAEFQAVIQYKRQLRDTRDTYVEELMRGIVE